MQIGEGTYFGRLTGRSAAASQDTYLLTAVLTVPAALPPDRQLPFLREG